MARRLRIQYSDAIYHVMARGNGRQDIVQDDADRGRLVAQGIGVSRHRGQTDLEFFARHRGQTDLEFFKASGSKASGSDRFKAS